MQWDDAEPNAGFSTAAPDMLYLPQDTDPQRPTVAAQHQDDDSPLNRLRRLIQLRRQTPELRPGTPTLVLSCDYPLVYQRGEQHLVVVNPAGSARTVEIPALGGRPANGLEVSGASITGTHVAADEFGYGIFHLGRPEADLAHG
jgi:maltose alpha-D-glucosyltransferase/alpha-amylase